MTVIETVKNSVVFIRALMRWAFDPTTGTITDKYLENGVEKTFTIPNAKKLQEQNIQNVQDALSEFRKTLYVDGAIGSDTNIGDSSFPLKTIKEACDRIPYGGSGYIKVKEGQNFVFEANERIDIQGKNLFFTVWGDRANAPTFIFKFGDFEGYPTKQGIGGIGSRYSYSSGSSTIGIYSIKIIEDTATRDASKQISTGANAIFLGSYDGTASNLSVNIIKTEVELVDSLLFSNAYAYYGDSEFWGTGLSFIGLYNASINITGAGYVAEAKNSTLHLAGNATINDADKWVYGVVRDADSGNPINVLSSINLSN